MANVTGCRQDARLFLSPPFMLPVSAEVDDWIAKLLKPPFQVVDCVFVPKITTDYRLDICIDLIHDPVV